jgi:eukaryotic-like serine/threonine-protein kinase
LTSLGGPQVGRPQWSPDGEWIAFHARVMGNSDIYLIRSSGGVPRRLTDYPSEEARPSWSRDGRWVYHTSQRGGANRIWKTPAEGGEAIRVTSSSGTTPWESVDGRFLYFVKSLPDRFPLWKTSVAGGEETQVLPSLADDLAFAVAAEGIYFNSNDSIQLLRFSDGSITTKAKLTKPASFGLSVSPDGRTILYTQVDSAGADLALVENFR